MSLLDDFAGGDNLLLGLMDVGSRPLIPATYFTPEWGKNTSGGINDPEYWNPEYWNPVHQDNHIRQDADLTDADIKTLAEWVPWLVEDTPFFQTAPQADPSATDIIKQLTEVWAAKNTILKEGYEKQRDWIKSK